jgi:hypothetical protein
MPCKMRPEAIIQPQARLTYPRAAYRLTAFIVVGAALASAGGLFLEDLYRDPTSIQAAWRGNDLVTLLLVVPLLSLVLRQAQSGSARAHLAWLGLLAYVFYNYAFYLFGAVFNSFFLLYAALFSCAMFALVLGLLQLDINQIRQQFRPLVPVKGVSLFLLFISLPLAIVEIGQCLNFMLNGKIPEAPPLIFALDLSLVVPTTALAAVLLWRRQPWGMVLAVMMLVKAFAYGLVLSLSAILIGSSSQLGYWDPFLPFYVMVTLGGLTGSLALLRHYKPETNGGAPL